jgi:hypothetical protein
VVKQSDCAVVVPPAGIGICEEEQHVECGLLVVGSGHVRIVAQALPAPVEIR